MDSCSFTNFEVANPLQNDSIISQVVMLTCANKNAKRHLLFELKLISEIHVHVYYHLKF